MAEKVTKDGYVAVLVSPGYGAGWSTWNQGHKEMLMFDRRLIEAAQAGTEDIDPIVKEIFGQEYICTLGWEDVEIRWVAEGEAFTINEYDGSESIQAISDISFEA